MPSKGDNPTSASMRQARETGGTIHIQTKSTGETLTIDSKGNIIKARPTIPRGTQAGHSVTDAKNFSRPVGGESGIGLGGGLPEQMK